MAGRLAVSWTLVLGSWQSSPSHVVETAKQRKLSWRLDAAAELSFTIDGRSYDAAQVDVLESDVWAYDAANVLRFRGRVIAAPDKLDADRHTMAVSAVDYRGLLSQRYLQTAKSYAATAQSAIVSDLVAHTQGQTNGTLGITMGTLPGGNARDRVYDLGDSVGERIAELGRVENGFEWWVDANRVLNLSSPKRGGSINLVLDYGGNVAAIDRTADAGAFLNHVLVTGDEGTTPKTAAASGLAGDARGRWESVQSFPSVKESVTLQGKANRAVVEGSKLPIVYGLTLSPTADLPWIDPGAGVTVRVVSGQLSEAVACRIFEVTVTLDDSGNAKTELLAVANT